MIVPVSSELGPPIRASVDWEDPDCPLCEGRLRDLVLEAPDPQPAGVGLWFAVVRCRNCGLLFTSPRPDEASIGQFYPSTYLPHRRRTGPRKPRRWYPLAALSGRVTAERRSLKPAGGGRLLDFGCGGGSFLDRMARQGWRVVGLDTAPAAVERVRTDLGLPAYVGTLPHPDLGPGSFDVVTMWHALEHVHRPLEVLRAAHELLTPGGRLFVAVPNVAGWPFRWFGRDWFGLDLPRHLTHFTPVTLRQILGRVGFAVERLRLVRHSDWLRSSARLAVERRPRTSWEKWLTLKPLARLAAWGCYAAGQSDCMLAIARKE